MKALVLFAAFVVGCQADLPTASKEAEVAKPVVQEFACEATVLDTVVRAVAPDSDMRLEVGGDGSFFERLTYSSYWDVDIGVYVIDRVEWTLVEKFIKPTCDSPGLKAILLEDIASSTYKIERYACAILAITDQMDKRLTDPNCGSDCWEGLKARLEQAENLHEHFQGELRYAKVLLAMVCDE